MKKDKLHTEDGSEFTVFYLGQEKGQIKHEPDDSVEEQIQDYFDKGKLFWGSDLPTSKEMKKAKNFLKDNNIQQKIVDLLNLNNNDHVLEIGPGYGALTQFLSYKVNQLTLKFLFMKQEQFY